MFTGIIETLAILKDIEAEGSNLHFTFESSLAPELKIDQSLAHNGICLTVTHIDTTQNTYRVTAIDETLQKTNAKHWQQGDRVNLERSMLLNTRLDGHLVQGHVDQTATCQQVIEEQGSWRYFFEYDTTKQRHVTVAKGSVCVNGVSLTVVDSAEGTFSVAIIPYTFEHTNFQYLQKGSIVNIEFDIIGKYVQRLLLPIHK